MSKRGQRDADGPTDISILLERLLNRPNLRTGLQVMRIHAIWEEVVGASAASSVTVSGISGDTLLLRARSGAWKAEINWQKKVILERCNAVLGDGVLKNIRFI